MPQGHAHRIRRVPNLKGSLKGHQCPAIEGDDEKGQRNVTLPCVSITVSMLHTRGWCDSRRKGVASGLLFMETFAAQSPHLHNTLDRLPHPVVNLAVVAWRARSPSSDQPTEETMNAIMVIVMVIVIIMTVVMVTAMLVVMFSVR